MKILNMAPSNLCNISTNLSHGINEYTVHTCRSVTLTPPPCEFDTDILWRANDALVAQLISECDVLHLNAWYFVDQELKLKILNNAPRFVIHGLARLYDKYDFAEVSSAIPTISAIWWRYYMHSLNKHTIGKKKVVLQYHGGDLRRLMSKADKNFINKHGFKVLVSVPDLLPQLKNTQWLPIPVPTDEELFKPLTKRDDKIIKIVHTPTEREAKKTSVLIDVVDALKRKYDVELIIIENTPYKECLKLKREAHISFDNIEFGSYAGCSIEAMCHEQPTLVYLNSVSQQQIHKVSEEIGIEPPFVNVGDPKQPSIEYLNRVIEGKARNIVTEKDFKSVYENLERLIVDSTLRKELGKRGRQWARRVHDVKVVVKKLIDIYESLSFTRVM